MRASSSTTAIATTFAVVVAVVSAAGGGAGGSAMVDRRRPPPPSAAQTRATPRRRRGRRPPPGERGRRSSSSSSLLLSSLLLSPSSSSSPPPPLPSIPPLAAVRGGGGAYDRSVVAPPSSSTSPSPPPPSPLTSSSRARATLAMATCMSLHYLAYSLARPATMTLFTSSRLGFGGGGGGGSTGSGGGGGGGATTLASAYPLAMTFISPASFLLLLWYGSVLERSGPRGALRTTTLGCALALGGCGLLVSRLDSMLPPPSSSSSSTSSTSSLAPLLTRYVVGMLFVFRESYVQLLTSQHWSFISSILTPAESSTWYGPVSGLTSITSALGAVGVGWLSGRVGLTGVLAIAGVALATSAYFGGMAYGIAERNGFDPTDEGRKEEEEEEEGSSSSSRRRQRSSGGGRGEAKEDGGGGGRRRQSSSSSTKTTTTATEVAERGLFAKARDVFARVPTLWALFCEILACQCLSTLLNVCFVTRVSESLPDDAERAGYVGRFYAGINVLSSALQFGVLPLTSKYVEPSALWRAMPLVSLGMTSLLSFPKLGVGGGGDENNQHPSLDLVAAAFLLMKTMEFSVRRMLDEMVYVPLDYESRFLGKEVIGVLGYRFGKSGASLALSAITRWFGGAMGVRELSYFATGAAGLWLCAAWRLSNLVPTKEEAEEAYRKMKKKA
ncbi:hypothetical protein ACHAW5_010554 [Stephanodiscus triporus]|uniref:ADP,ATP carrier protein n=1 Tax=Stephanodiscus triporus TaxID=2934178 RepID=A0ABD3PJX9_9STRA